MDLTNFIAILVPKRLRHLVFMKFLCLQITAETSKIKKRTLRGLYFAFNALLKNFNILTFFLQEIWNIVTYRKKKSVTFYKGFNCYCMVFMNYIDIGINIYEKYI